MTPEERTRTTIEYLSNLKERPLSSVSVWRTPLRGDLLDLVLHVVRSDTRVTHLTLRGCSIDEKTIKKIGEAIRDNVTLIYLDISSNDLGMSGFYTFLDELNGNTTLEETSVCDINLDRLEWGRPQKKRAVSRDDILGALAQTRLTGVRGLPLDWYMSSPFPSLMARNKARRKRMEGVAVWPCYLSLLGPHVIRKVLEPLLADEPSAEYNGAKGIRRTLSMDLDKAYREAEAEKAEQAAAEAPSLPMLPSAVLPIQEEEEDRDGKKKDPWKERQRYKKKEEPRFDSNQVD